jgi:predicted DNA-binding protein
MVRTTTRLPDELYAKLNTLAKENGWSLAEALRRGADLLLRTRASKRTRRATWKLPSARHLGSFAADVSCWRALAHDPSSG